MWIYFYENGRRSDTLTHGTPARVGSNDFSIFAFFENINVEDYSVATITLQKPDLSQRIYLQLQMRIKHDNEYIRLPDDPTVSHFEEGEPYTGYLFDFADFTSEEDTVILLDTPGQWTASITLYSSNPVLRSVSGTITFNVQGTAYPTEEEELTMQAILGNIAQELTSFEHKFSVNNVRGYATWAAAEADKNNLSENQIIYVSDPGEFYQKVSGSLVRINNNDIEQRDYPESTPLQAIYDEVGLGKLFYSRLDGLNGPHWNLLYMSSPVEDSYELYFWNELGYGETDTIQDLSETIDNFTFHYTGSYFPYVSKNDLGGSLTDDELAILSQPNSVFICVGIIMHKVSSTRFERISVSATGANMSIVTQYVTINTSAKTFAFNNSYIPAYTSGGIDGMLSQKQNTLISGFNIKTLTINGVIYSLLGSGTIQIVSGSGGNVEWGNIGGDITDQTDLQNELTEIREVAEGKSKTLAIRAEETAITSSNFNVYDYKKADGTSFEDFADFLNYVNAEYEENLHLINTDFLSQNGSIQLNTSLGAYLLYYIGDDQWIVYTLQYIIENYKTGDIFLIDELNYPDRWFKATSGGYYYFNKLETSKINLNDYATKTDLNNAIASLNANLAGLYDSTLVYAKGQVVIHDNKLYSCTTAITTPEAWDSTHWTQTTIASEFVNLHGSQVVDGDKNFTGALQKSGVDVADINHAFNVINASDIVNNTLTQAQYDLITNGKITIIKGVFLSGYDNYVLFPPLERLNDFIFEAHYTTGYPAIVIGAVQLVKSTKVISLNTSRFFRGEQFDAVSTNRFNNKQVPAYPSSTGTFGFKSVNGTLSWQQEWYGTQAQYDALGTYDSNTIYYIEEE